MSRIDVTALGARWINDLRLQDRIIDVRYVRGLCDASGAPLYGQLRIDNLDEGRFSVFIQDPDTWPAVGSRELSEQSIEEALVHELVHVRWIDLTADKEDATALLHEERATWATARALINAKGSTRAAMVRAMTASKTALTRAQTKGTKMIDAATAKQILDALDGEDVGAMKTALRGIVESALTGGESAPASGVGGMGADAGSGAGGVAVDPSKDKGPMSMADEQAKCLRAMRANVAETEAAAAIVRGDAKRAIVRGMAADGIVVTPHAEKQILEAKTVEEAQALERMARSMAGKPVEGARKPAATPGDRNASAGLTRSQATKYDRMVNEGSPRAEAFRDECIKANEAAKKGGA